MGSSRAIPDPLVHFKNRHNCALTGWPPLLFRMRPLRSTNGQLPIIRTTVKS